MTDSRPDEGDLAELDAYGMAATIAFELDAKQELLELRSETERLSRLAGLCVRALERFDYAQQAAGAPRPTARCAARRLRAGARRVRSPVPPRRLSRGCGGTSPRPPE